MTEADLFEFYQISFKLIYADLVAAEGKKFLEIDAQIESAMSHLALSKTCGDAKLSKTNLESAYTHVGRACLDAAKLLWLNRRKLVEEIMKDDLKRKFGGAKPEGTLWQLYNEAEKKARKARRADAEGAGHITTELVSLYYDAVNTYQEILDSMDWGRLNAIKKFRLSYIFKQQFLGFILGIIAGIISGLLLAHL